MKSVTSLSKRVRVSLALFTALAVVPLGSAFHSADAKPKHSAPAYGYRAKQQKRENKRERREDRRDRRDDRRDDRDDRRDDRDDRRDDRNDRYRYSNGTRYNGRPYTTRYRTITNSAGERIRQYFRVYR